MCNSCTAERYPQPGNSTRTIRKVNKSKQYQCSTILLMKWYYGYWLGHIWQYSKSCQQLWPSPENITNQLGFFPQEIKVWKELILYPMILYALNACMQHTDFTNMNLNTLTNTHTLFLSLSFSLSFSLPLSLPLSLSLSLTHIHTHTHAYTHMNTHTHHTHIHTTHTCTHTHTHTTYTYTPHTCTHKHTLLSSSEKKTMNADTVCKHR